jgi:hypothetical protein
MVKYIVKSYRRSDGTLVHKHSSRSIGRGRSRGRKTGIFSRSKGYRPFISKKRSGKLGSPGFLSKSKTRQHKILDGCMKKYGKRSCLGSVNVLKLNKIIFKKYGPVLKELSKYVSDK